MNNPDCGKDVKDCEFGRGLCLAIAIFLIAVGAARMVSTYTVFSATADEPIHIAAGMRWLEQREYFHDHPPLARVAAALPLYIAGIHPTDVDAAISLGGLLREGHDVIYSGGAYAQNLRLARFGILPFFLVACLVVWLWAERLFGRLAAVLAVLLFTTLPAILAHGALATTDMAVTAFLPGAIYAFLLWLENPTMRRGLLLGILLGLSVLSKVSSLLFFPVCGFLLFGLNRYRLGFVAGKIRGTWRSLLLCCLSAFLVVWAGYRFSFSPLTTPMTRPHVTSDRIFGNAGFLHDMAYFIVETPVPAVDLINGVLYTWNHNAEGHHSYLLGEIRKTGWWYFFPVALAVKTPVPFLLLCAIGLLLLARRRDDSARWSHWAPALCAIAILLLCLPSRINLGVRHILPVYPMLAIVAGYAAAWLIEVGRRSKTALILTLILLLWQLTSSALAHPDYLAYFNELAGNKPERILIDSDLDWGQDLNRLAEKLRELNVDQVSIAYFGGADLKRHGIPRWKPLPPNVPTTGWIAISVFRQKISVTIPGEGRVFNGFSWLENKQPVARVGKTILLYFVPPAENAG